MDFSSHLTKSPAIQGEKDAIPSPFDSAADNISRAKDRPLVIHLRRLSIATPIVAVVSPRGTVGPWPRRVDNVGEAATVVTTVAPARGGVAWKFQKRDIPFTQANADDAAQATLCQQPDVREMQ